MKKFFVLACLASFALIIGCDDDSDKKDKPSCKASCDGNIRNFCDASGKLQKEDCGAAGCDANTLQCKTSSSDQGGKIPAVGDGCGETSSDFCNGDVAIYCNTSTQKYESYDCTQDKSESKAASCVMTLDWWGEGINGSACVIKDLDECDNEEVGLYDSDCEDSEVFYWVCAKTNKGNFYVMDDDMYEECANGCDEEGIECAE